MVATISDAMLRLIAVNEPTSKRCGWRGGVLLKPRRLLHVCSTFVRVLLEFCLSFAYTPCLRLAPMKSSRSPSSTAFVLLISTFVRRSLMRLLSSTYERIW
jgi:hypothetical protein